MEENKESGWETIESTGSYWKPEKEGEVIEGTLSEIKEGGKYGTDYTLVTIEQEQVKLPSHRVLQNLMARCKVGDYVRITFVGSQPPKVRGENPTLMYKVERRI